MKLAYLFGFYVCLFVAVASATLTFLSLNEMFSTAACSLHFATAILSSIVTTAATTVAIAFWFDSK